MPRLKSIEPGEDLNEESKARVLAEVATSENVRDKNDENVVDEGIEILQKVMVVMGTMKHPSGHGMGDRLSEETRARDAVSLVDSFE